MSINLKDPERTANCLVEFLECFDQVFHTDWEFTKWALENIDEVVSPNGTFLQPKVSDERDNWANRGALLDAYRKLQAELLLMDAGKDG